MLKKIHKTKIFKISARLLLVVFAMHVLSVHSLAESLVYCFEDNGDINVESTAKLGILFNSKSEVHENVTHDHDHNEEAVFHQGNDDHRDVPISLLCAKEDKLNRFDQQKTVADLKRAVFQKIEITPASRSLQQTIFLPLFIENYITTNLQTVVLLN
ncbi:MAG: hypothetical protein CL666_10035 [Balneola sp.]|nr:hypothetical protein [Balneola sp.]